MLDSQGSILSVAAQADEPGDQTSEPDGCRPDRVRGELRRVLASSQFDASDRNRRFLAYVVEETLMGRGQRIKAYSIATLVFGRDAGFDPALDPVVRMEARRLRRSLERFYLVEGDGEFVRISLPKGGYLPKFDDPSRLSLARCTVSPQGEGRQRCQEPSILVCAFQMECSSPGEADYSDGLARRIVVGLGRVPGLGVFMPRPFPPGGARQSPDPQEACEADFVLGGNTSVEGCVMTVTVTLLDARDGRVVWAETLAAETTSRSIFAARDQLAAGIVAALSKRMAGSRPDPGRTAGEGVPRRFLATVTYPRVVC
jgi:adenylate cyclase